MKPFKYSSYLAALLCLVIFISSCGSGENGEKPAGGGDSTSSQKPETKGPEIPKDAMFKIKSATVKYEISGKLENGQAEFMFDDYGNLSAYRKTVTVMGGSKEDMTFTWNAKEKTGWVINHIKKTASKSYFRSKDSEAPALASQSDDTKKKIGYERMPDEEIAGKKCEVWKNAKSDVSYWIWNNVELKIVNNSLGKETGMGRTALIVEENGVLPNYAFEIPEGYSKK